MSILTRVQSNPEILLNNATFVSDLVERCKNFITSYCRLSAFPDGGVGKTISGAGAATNLTTLSSGSLDIKVNDTPYISFSIDPSVCTSGANIASELQSKIRAIGEYDHMEVTVTFDEEAGTYTISSGRFGPNSQVVFSGNGYPPLNQALKLTRSYGADLLYGSYRDDTLEDAAVMLVEQKYRLLGLEGMQSGSIPGGVSFSLADIDPTVRNLLTSRRAL